MLLPGGTSVASAQDQGPAPQIVRVSYVEGDVRVSRGKDAEKQTHAAWEQAAVDLPIEEGYSLVTGAGRAEIEFEDASVAYLAANSVLVFNNLESIDGIPQTELALLSGAMTLAAAPMVASEMFVVRTPTDSFSVHYPDRAFLRVNSYLDGITVTSMGSGTLRLDHSVAVHTSGGHPLAYSHGKQIAGDKLADSTSYAEFDQWVLQRAKARGTAMTETMREAGLKEPVPGLAQLQGQGHFYACPPYGTCWEPTNGFAGQTTEAEKAAMAQSTVSVKTLAKGGPNSVPNLQTSQNQGLGQEFDAFPCSPFGWNSSYLYDPATGRMLLRNGQLLPIGYGFGMSPYQWAVCHTGSWIQNRGRYVWVTGTRRHHYPPVHWIKTGHDVGFVPIHPHDVAGKTPLNLKDGFVHPIGKNGSQAEMLAINSGAKVKVLNEVPGAFQRQPFVALSKAEAPRAEAHLLKPSSAETKAAGTPITFDHRSQSFMVAGQGGSASAAPASKRMEPIGGRNSDLQPHSGGGGGGGAEMSRGGGGSPAGNYSRGGSGSGGSSGSSAGVSHASAPPPAPAPAPAPAMSAPSASAPAGKR